MENQKKVYGYNIIITNNIICTSFYNENESNSLSFILSKEKNDTLDLISFMKNNVKGLVGFNNIQEDQYILHLLTNTSAKERVPSQIISNSNTFKKELKETNKYFSSNWPQLDLNRLINDKGKDITSIAYSNKLQFFELDEFQYLDFKTISEYGGINAKTIWSLFKINNDKLKLRSSLKSKTGIDFNNVKEIDIIPRMIKNMLKLKSFVKFDFDNSVVPLSTILMKNEFKTEEFKKVYDYFNSKSIIKTEKELSFKILYQGIRINYSTAGFYSDIEPSITNGMIFYVDAVKFYPTILNNYDIYPKFIGPKFNEAYRNCIKILDGDHKVSLNAVVGKFNKPGNPLYDKKSWLKVSINAQLIFSRFIEGLSLVSPDVQILSIKTDGVYFKVPDNSYYDILDFIADWQDYSGFELKFKRLDKLVVRDANNVLEILDGKVIGSSGLFKKFRIPIVGDAVVKYFLNGSKIEDVIINKNNVISDYTMLHKAFKESRNYISSIENKKQLIFRNVNYVVSEKGYGLFYETFGSKNPKRVLTNSVIVVNEIKPDLKISESNINIDYRYYLSAAKSIIDKIENKQLSLIQ